MNRQNESGSEIKKKEWIKPVFEQQSLKDALSSSNGTNSLGSDLVEGTLYS